MTDGDITWTRAAGCESSSCAEWRLEDGSVWLRSSDRPGRAVRLTLAEFWQLVEAAVNGEVVTLDG